MQASELVMGQRFRFIDTPTEYIRVWQHGGKYLVSYLNPNSWQVSGCAGDLEVTPVTGWDEPQVTPMVEPEPAPLQLREGAWYRRRDGKGVGPCCRRRKGDPDSNSHPWECPEGYWYTHTGKRWNHPDNQTDLIAEVPPPVASEQDDWIPGDGGFAEVPPPNEPSQFKPGDWVAVVSHSVFRGKTGIVTEIVCGKHDTLPVHIEFADESNWFGLNEIRRATPAEVAAYKQAQEPQQLKPTCLADGKSCDRNTACAGSVCAFFECQEPQPDADRRNPASGDITHYHLVPSLQPAPIITDWVSAISKFSWCVDAWLSQPTSEANRAN